MVKITLNWLHHSHYDNDMQETLVWYEANVSPDLKFQIQYDSWDHKWIGYMFLNDCIHSGNNVAREETFEDAKEACQLIVDKLVDSILDGLKNQ